MTLTLKSVLDSILLRLDMNEFDSNEALRQQDMISERLDSIEEFLIELDHRLDNLEVLVSDLTKLD